MSDDYDDVVDNVKQGSTWFRILFILGYCLVLYVVAGVVIVLTLAQALFSVFTGEDNQNLRLLGSSLVEYVSQILNFMTYNSNQRPFPFSPFPESRERSAEVEQEPIETGAPARRKPSAKKKPSARKKTAASVKKKTAGESNKETNESAD
ncbi:MAG: DUF4389 domain-containing protein [Gammaproteobacteria bacterium]|nr:DUF4389 domain-containing protein [Gammaproteobacteria bacterium]